MDEDVFVAVKALFKQQLFEIFIDVCHICYYNLAISFAEVNE